MTKYAVFNDEGFPAGFYDEDIHGCREIDSESNPNCIIPANATKITDEQWQDFLLNGGRRKWQHGGVVPFEPPVPEPVIPDRVTRRQFRLQLIDAGLLEQVEAWVATQDIRTQAAYADSGTFLRTDEMLQQGFAGLGFTDEQVDAFFTDAAVL